MPFLQAIWHGSNEERDRLLAIIDTNCPHEKKCKGVLTTSLCGPHKMLLSQHDLDGLVCSRRDQARIRAEEWKEKA